MANESATSNIFLYFLAIFLPPVPVYLKAGFGADFFINILLCILAFFPGIIHAWYIISRHGRATGGGYGYNRTPAATTADTAPGFSDKTPAPATTAPATTAPATTAPATTGGTTTAPGTSGYGATPEATGETAKPAY